MSNRRAIGLLAGLALIAASGPASAEGFLESIFGSKSAAPPAQAAPDPSAKQGSTPKPAAPRRAAGAEAKASAGAEAAKDGSGRPRPDTAKQAAADSSRKATPAAPGLAGTQTLAAVDPAVTAPGPTGPLGDAAVLERANAFFNGITTLVGDFTQVGADGRKLTGKLYLARPGRLRFDYDEPSTLEVVADGSAVAVRDRKLGTQDAYFIKDTPLKFLLQDKIDLARDQDLKEIAADPGGFRIVLEDRSAFRGTTMISLYFDPEVRALSQWRIIDAQGIQTTVVLTNTERGRRFDANLFVITY